MIRHHFISILCLLLCIVLLPWGSGVAADAETEHWYEPTEVFSGVVGKIAFALPGRPVRLNDEDTEGFWRDSWQMYSRCAMDEEIEYQFHTADITPWIDSLLESHYAFSRADAALQVMFDYSCMTVNSYNGTVTGLRKQWKDGFAYLTFDFVLPDNPEFEYSAKAVFDGTRVATILCGKCDHTEQILSLLAPATEAQLIAGQPQTVDFKGLSVTVTDKAQIIEDSDISILMCLTNDCTFFYGRYNDIDVTLDLFKDTRGKDEALKLIAGHEAEPVGCSNIHDGVVTALSSFDMQYDFQADMDVGFETFPYVGRVYVTREGLWSFWADDNETGRAIISSIEFPGKSGSPSDKPSSIIDSLKDPEPDELVSLPSSHLFSSGMDLANAYASVTPRKNSSDPATLYQFVTAFNDLYCSSDLSFIEVSLPFFSNGRWVRLLRIDEISLVAVLSLSGSNEEVFVNGLHVLWLEGSTVDEKAFCNFAALCARALTGDSTILASEESILSSEVIVSDSYTMQYDSLSEMPLKDIKARFLMDANQPAVVTGATLGPRPGWNSTSGSFIPRAYAVTLDEFEQNWERINDFFYNGEFPLSWLGTGDEYGLDPSMMLLYVNYDTLLQVLTETVGDKVYVIQVFVSPVEDDLEYVKLCSTIAFAAAAGMNEGQYLGLLGGLSEYCTWETAITLWPMAAKGHVMLYLVEDPDGGPEDHLGCIVGFH